MSLQRCGIFGSVVITRDKDGFVEIPVIIQESGLFAGAPPPECRIHTVAAIGDDQFNKAYVAKLNRGADLPFYLSKAKVKIVGDLQKVTDEDLAELGITPLPVVQT